MDLVNDDQAEHWNSNETVGHWVDEQARYDGTLEPFVEIILDGAALGRTDGVLDVGCGCGATTLAAARAATDGRAHGVDLSVAMLERARADARRADIGNATFEQADAQVHPFERAAFDAVISRFGIMFFADPVAAFSNLRRATTPGGRLAFVCWQSMLANDWQLVPSAALARHVPPPEAAPPGAPGMYAFADADRPREVLEAAGWQHVDVQSRQTSLLVGGRGTVDDAVGFVRRGTVGRTMLADADPDTERRALDSLRDALAQHADRDGVRLGAAVWLVTATA